MSEVPLDLVDSRTLYERVKERIRFGIIHGQLPSGTHLREAQLAEQLGVSRGPVREALRELARDGYVMNLPYRGSFVTSLSPEALYEVYSMRGLLEGYAAATAIETIRATRLPIIWDKLVKLVDAVESERFEDIAELDAAFHEEICSACGYPRLTQVWETFNAPLQAQFASRVKALYSPDEIIDRHHFLFDQLGTASNDEIEKNIREHYLETARRMIKTAPNEQGGEEPHQEP